QKTSLLHLQSFYGLDQDHDQEKVLVDNKCQCVKVTSKFVASKDDPDNEVLVRNIRIVCDNCHSSGNPENGQRVGESGLCNDPQEPCYTYDRNKCYTAPCLFNNAGKTETIETALTPESCYDD
uniref:Joining chain of multimeric IgA and IgM n=1 Tax=Anolis carolinensis TaxID=28377 RepID=A0A803TG78_ANOCA